MYDKNKKRFEHRSREYQGIQEYKVTKECELLDFLFEIYKDSFYSRRMIYPRKNEKFTFNGLMELADSIKKNGYITSIKYHSDDLKMTMQIFVDRGRDPIDIIGMFEDLVAEYDINVTFDVPKIVRNVVQASSIRSSRVY